MEKFKTKQNTALMELQHLRNPVKFPLIASFLEKDPTCSPWSAIALVIWYSQTDQEAHSVMNNVLSRCTNFCLVYDIVEFFYFLASVFYCLELHHGTGIYSDRVFCTLYLYGNMCAATGQQSQCRTSLTYEQARIIIQDVKSGELVKIEAFAGKS